MYEKNQLCVRSVWNKEEIIIDTCVYVKYTRIEKLAAKVRYIVNACFSKM